MDYSSGFGRSIKGFTLIELMVALAILAIIVAVAIPAYTTYVVRSNRTEGKVIAMQAAQALERCYTRYSAYNSDECDIGFPLSSENDWYEVTVDDLAASAFTVIATPQGSQATRDDGCGNLTLNHQGVRGVSGDDPVDDCW